MRAIPWMVALLLAGTLAARGEGNIVTTQKWAWAENAGWQNWRPAFGGVTVVTNGVNGYLKGYAWGENVGWVKLGDGTGPYANNSPTDWGVNLAADGKLSGYAWGENVGWIKFSNTLSQVTISMANGEFSGHAWGENIGWVKLRGTGPDYGVRTTFELAPPPRGTMFKFQ